MIDAGDIDRVVAAVLVLADAVRETSLGEGSLGDGLAEERYHDWLSYLARYGRVAPDEAAEA